MDSLLKASENFEQVSDEFDEKLFVEFMKKSQFGTFTVLARNNILLYRNKKRDLKFLSIIPI